MILFERLVDPTEESLVDRSKLLGIRDSKSLWSSQASGVKIPENIVFEIEELLDQRVSSRIEPLPIDDRTYIEGRVRQVTMNLAERSAKARRDAIQKHGVACKVCDFDFEATFGALGKGFIHFHHTDPVGGRLQPSNTSLDELVPVCPNCHSMLHREKIPLSISQLKKILSALH